MIMKYFTFLPLLCGVIYFGHCFFISIVLKKCGQSVYIGKFGLPLPWFPIYAECPHRYVWTFAIFRKTITICGRLNLSLIKQMLIYVCCLSVVLCHRRVVFVSIFVFLLFRRARKHRSERDVCSIFAISCQKL